MRKHLREKHSSISLRSGHPDCLLTILHIMKYHNWRSVKKRLVHKKHNGGRPVSGNNDAGDETNAYIFHQVEDNRNVRESMGESTSSSKSSFKSRIKALIPEEICKKRGRHHRSSTYPTHPTQSLLTRTDSIHHLKSSNFDPFSESVLDEENPSYFSGNNEISLATNDKCETDFEPIQLVEPPPNMLVENHEHISDTLIHHSKEFSDALNIINVNKNLLLNFLQDPSSPLALHFSNQHALSARVGLTKSRTFPAPCLSNRPKKQGENQMVIKRFKDLRKKIKHVIKESKKERHRITMDAIIHKIPHGRGLSKMNIHCKFKDPTEDREDKDSPVSSYDSDYSISSPGKGPWRHMNRTSSLNESLDRYCQLYETSFDREVNERLKLRSGATESSIWAASKSLGRIYSLPDLKSYVYHREDSFDVLSSWTPRRTKEDRSLRVSIVGETNIQEKLVEAKEEDEMVSVANNESVGIVNKFSKEESISGCADTKPASEIDDIAEITSSIFVPDFSEADIQGNSCTDPSPAAESEVDLKIVDSLSKLNYSFPFLDVEATEKAEFNYVQDVLELSGFTGNGFLGTWHSDDQPVDPSIYEEVEGCLLLDPECAGNEEGGKCDHFLLFDLINEVLVEIYGRSYSYYPAQLSCLSHIHQMPTGHHVLKEVWEHISWYMSFRPQVDHPLDYVVSRDIAKNDGWLNLQFDSECVGLELDNLIFEELLDEAIMDLIL